MNEWMNECSVNVNQVHSLKVAVSWRSRTKVKYFETSSLNCIAVVTFLQDRSFAWSWHKIPLFPFPIERQNLLTRTALVTILRYLYQIYMSWTTTNSVTWSFDAVETLWISPWFERGLKPSTFLSIASITSAEISLRDKIRSGCYATKLQWN